MKGEYIFPPSRPTPSSRGTTKFREEVRNPKEEDAPKRLRCLQCGFINKDTVAKCAVCEAPNWKGDYA